MSTLTVEERKQVGEDFRVLGPIFLNIPATKLAVIVMHEVMSSTLRYGGSTAYKVACALVGRALKVEWEMDALKGSHNRFQVGMVTISFFKTNRSPTVEIKACQTSVSP